MNRSPAAHSVARSGSREDFTKPNLKIGHLNTSTQHIDPGHRPRASIQRCRPASTSVCRARTLPTFSQPFRNLFASCATGEPRLLCQLVSALMFAGQSWPDQARGWRLAALKVRIRENTESAHCCHFLGCFKTYTPLIAGSEEKNARKYR